VRSRDENVCKSVNNWQCKPEFTPKQTSESQWPDGMQSVPVKTTQKSPETSVMLHFCQHGHTWSILYYAGSTYNVTLRH